MSPPRIGQITWTTRTGSCQQLLKSHHTPSVHLSLLTQLWFFIILEKQADPVGDGFRSWSGADRRPLLLWDLLGPSEPACWDAKRAGTCGLGEGLPLFPPDLTELNRFCSDLRSLLQDEVADVLPWIHLTGNGSVFTGKVLGFSSENEGTFLPRLRPSDLRSGCSAPRRTYSRTAAKTEAKRTSNPDENVSTRLFLTGFRPFVVTDGAENRRHINRKNGRSSRVT